MPITKYRVRLVALLVVISGCVLVEVDPKEEMSPDHGTTERFEGRVVSLIEDHADGARQSVWLNVVGRPPLRLALANHTDEIATNDRVAVDGELKRDGLLVVDRVTRLETGATAVSAPCSPIGAQSTAVLVAVAPGESPLVSTAQLDAWFFGSDPSVDGYLRDASYGQASAAGVVLGPYTLDREYTCSERPEMTVKLLELAGPDIFLPDFQRVFVVYDFGTYPTQCSWNGIAQVGCSNYSDSTDGTYTAGYAWLNENSLVVGGPNQGPNDGLSIVIHEMGHLLGIGHAQSRASGPEPIGAPGVATLLDEYGDLHSVMGQGRTAGFGRFTHFAAPHKDRLGWLNDAQVTTVLADGTYLVSPYENLDGAGVRALKIQRPTPIPEWLWLEMRQPIGAYDTTSLASVYGHALVHIEDASSGTKSQLIDFTPQSDFVDATLHVGSIWTDPYSGLSISVSPSGSDLQIGVTYGPAPCMVAPAGVVIDPAIVSTTAEAGTASFTLTIANNDTGTCPAEQAFGVAMISPTGWESTTGVMASPFAVPNDDSTTMPIAQTVPVTAVVGDYTVSAQSARGGTTATATATVSILPTVTATVPGMQFVHNQTVTFTARITSGGVGVNGKAVTFRLKNPNNTVTTSTKTTNATGIAVWTYKLRAVGLYSLTATGTIQGKTGTSDPQGFTVIP